MLPTFYLIGLGTSINFFIEVFERASSICVECNVQTFILNYVLIYVYNILYRT